MPEPILIAIAAALAGRGAGSLYDLVRNKFAGRPEAAAALAAAEGAAPESPEVAALGEELALAERTDPGFAAELHALWAGGVVNRVTGNVSGKVVQARDIQGGVSL